MKRTARHFSHPVIVAGLTLLLGLSPAGAALIHTDFSGNECGGKGGFPNCYAGDDGTQQGPGEGLTPAIYKRDKGGSEDFGNFPTINGDEFTLNFDDDTDVLEWSYTRGPGDPLITFFSIKQGDGFTLFRNDDHSPIFSFSDDINALLGYNDFSHVTWFDTAGAVVPAPAALPLLLTGIAAIFGFRRMRRNPDRA